MSRAAPVREMPVTLCARGTAPAPRPHPFAFLTQARDSQAPSSAQTSLLQGPPLLSRAQPLLESAKVPAPLPLSHSPFPPRPAVLRRPNALRPPAPSWSISRVPPCQLSADPRWSPLKLIPQFPPHLPEACLLALLRHLKPLKVQRDK